MAKGSEAVEDYVGGRDANDLVTFINMRAGKSKEAKGKPGTVKQLDALLAAFFEDGASLVGALMGRRGEESKPAAKAIARCRNKEEAEELGQGIDAAALNVRRLDAAEEQSEQGRGRIARAKMDANLSVQRERVQGRLLDALNDDDKKQSNKDRVADFRGQPEAKKTKMLHGGEIAGTDLFADAPTYHAVFTVKDKDGEEKTESFSAGNGPNTMMDIVNALKQGEGNGFLDAFRANGFAGTYTGPDGATLKFHKNSKITACDSAVKERLMEFIKKY